MHILDGSFITDGDGLDGPSADGLGGSETLGAGEGGGHVADGADQ